MIFRRFSSFFLDYLLIGLLVGVVQSVGSFEDYRLILTMLVMYFGYFFILYITFGMTCGEKLLKLRTVLENSTLEDKRLDTSSIFFRSFALVIPLGIPLLWLVILLPKKRSFADRVSNTKVIHI